MRKKNIESVWELAAKALFDALKKELGFTAAIAHPEACALFDVAVAQSTAKIIVLKTGDIIRYRYQGEYEYSKVLGYGQEDNSLRHQIICGQHHLDAWQVTGLPTATAQPEIAQELLDKSICIVEGTWKKEQFFPKRVIGPGDY